MSRFVCSRKLVLSLFYAIISCIVFWYVIIYYNSYLSLKAYAVYRQDVVFFKTHFQDACVAYVIKICNGDEAGFCRFCWPVGECLSLLGLLQINHLLYIVLITE